NRSTSTSRAAIKRCVLMSTESMHNALLFSMKPIPPMSAARLYTSVDPWRAVRHASISRRSSWRLSLVACNWYQSLSGFRSTALLPHGLGPSGVGHESIDRLGEIGPKSGGVNRLTTRGCVEGHQGARLAVDDDLEDPSHGAGHHGRLAGHGLDIHETERLVD